MLPPAPAPAPTQRPPASGLRPPSRAVATARKRYQTDGNSGMSGGRLLVALYDRLLKDLHGAETAIQSAQVEAAHLHLIHAQDIVDSLDDALDQTAWDEAERLGQIYAHVRSELVRANTLKSAAIVTQCRTIIEPLSATWREALELTSGAAVHP